MGELYYYKREVGHCVTDQMGRPWTRDEWMEVRAEIDAYFATNPDQEITQARLDFYNRYLNPNRTREPSQPRKPKPKTGYIYLIKAENTPWCKIGRSNKPVSRTNGIGTKSPFKCTVLRTIAVADTESAEAALHTIFADRRAEGEWFTLLPADVDWLMTTTATTAEGFKREAV